MGYKETAIHYNNAWGINILPLCGKVPNVHEWANWQTEKQSNKDIEEMPWNSNVTGLGGIMGMGDLRVIDFDWVRDNRIIQYFAIDLGLGEHYEWIVRSGSGFHIWFYCQNNEKLFNLLNGEKSYYVLKLKDKGFCKHIELRWKNCQTVLPPSVHVNGNRYAFIKGEPKGMPATVPGENLTTTLKQFCLIETKKINDENTDAIKEKKTNLQQTEKENLIIASAAVDYLKGKINNYDDWMKLGFALASLNEAGRDLFLALSKNNKRYTDSDVEINKKFDGFLRDYNGTIKLGTLINIAQKYGYEIFNKYWIIKNNNAKFLHNKYLQFLNSEGYRKLFINGDYTFVYLNRNIIKEISLIDIKDHVLLHIDKIKDQKEKQIVLDLVLSKAANIFNYSILECLNTLKLELCKDDINRGYFFFSNCFIEVTTEKIKVKQYDRLYGMIWENKIIKHSYELTEAAGEFEKFVENICKGDYKRVNTFMSVLGYLVHRYKNPNCSKAIILTDEKISNTAMGRTGKGIIARAVGLLRKSVTIDGRNFKFDRNFAFQGVNMDSEIIYFDDIHKNFNFERLFSIITDGMTIEKKNKTEIRLGFDETPKIIVSTNFIITGHDDSSLDRQFVLEFTDYYNRGHKPVDDFKHLLFNDWDEKEWNLFYNFMVRCVQVYLKYGLIDYDQANIINKKIIAETSKEFLEYMDKLDLEQEYNKKFLYDEFIFLHDENGTIKQNTFTKWLKIFAEIRNIVFLERKSGDAKFVKFKKMGKSV